MKTRKAVCDEILANGKLCGNDHLMSQGKCSVHWKSSEAMAKELSHTPTPWKVSLALENNAPNYYAVTDGKWGSPTIAKCYSEADAKHIVRAVNAHEELVNALYEALKIADYAMDADLFGTKKSGVIRDGVTRRVTVIREALANAEGK
jgi:hypothetical protein